MKVEILVPEEIAEEFRTLVATGGMEALGITGMTELKEDEVGDDDWGAQDNWQEDRQHNNEKYSRKACSIMPEDDTPEYAEVRRTFCAGSVHKGFVFETKMRNRDADTHVSLFCKSLYITGSIRSVDDPEGAAKASAYSGGEEIWVKVMADITILRIYSLQHGKYFDSSRIRLHAQKQCP